MGIKSTVEVGRSFAIFRIKQIASLVDSKNYRGVELVSHEPNKSPVEFVDAGVDVDVANIENFTDRMLEDILDRPFYRHSMFDNYRVSTKPERVNLREFAEKHGIKPMSESEFSLLTGQPFEEDVAAAPMTEPRKEIE